MTQAEALDTASMMAEADRKGAELRKLEERNRKRRAKGRKPLPDEQERKDMESSRTRYRSDDRTTVDSADALKLFEYRKAKMNAEANSDSDEELDDLEKDYDGIDPRERTSEENEQDPVKGEDQAIREAEAARRVQDLKNGRIDHAGNWSQEGSSLEGGDPTVFPGATPPASDQAVPPRDPNPEGTLLEAFRNDLYQRLGVSFDGLERTLSDLQGRVSEIVTATTPKESPKEQDDDRESEFKKLLEQRTPVTFDVGGTRMTFDAICVFSATPCITVVSNIGSAKIMPKPGAQLLLSYDMDGKRYENDPVTFLGTRFDLPMFGLSFVGFIRDSEADMIDAAAGIAPAIE